MVPDLAGEVEAEGHRLASVPADVTHIPGGGTVNRLPINEDVAVALEPVHRPCERRSLAELPDVVDVELHVHVPSIVAPERAHARHAGAGARVVPADGGGVDAGVRAGIERRAAQRVQRRQRAVDVDRRRPVQ